VLAGLPTTFGVPVVVVQHRGPEPGGALVHALAARSALAVAEAHDKDALVPGRVALAPAGYHLLVERGFVALSTGPPERHSRPSINVLFESVADAYGPAAAGVLLTGASDDGAAGLARIREGGGVAVVQDPATAERDTMPLAAIAASTPHRVLALEEIAGFLTKLCGMPAGQRRRPLRGVER